MAAPTVNHPPTITSFAPTTDLVGQRYTYQVAATDPDSDVLTYALSNRPAGMAIDPSSGLIAWQPNADQVGISPVVVRVTDGRGGVDLQAFQVAVTRPDTPPVITSTPRGPAEAGSPYQYAIAAQDADGDPLSFALVSGPVGMAVDASSGLLTWTPPAGTPAEGVPVEVSADDGRGGVATQTFTLSVNPVAPDRPPAFTSTPRTTAQVGTAYLEVVTATDPDGDPITFTLKAAPAGMGFDPATGALRWTPSPDEVGSDPVAIVVSDGRGLSAEQDFTITVSAQAVNHPPTITSTPIGSAVVGTPYVYDASAVDPDGDALAWSLGTHPAGMSIGAADGAVRWTPSADEIGPQAVQVRVTDPYGAGQVQSFTVIVRGTNSPPVITSTAVTSAAVGHAYSYAVRATDADGDRLAYTLATAPAGMAIDPASGVISWTPSGDQSGPQAVALLVDDGRGGSATQTFTVTVAPARPDRPPTITSTPGQAAVPGSPYQYQVAATDPDGDPITFRLLSGPAGMTISASGLVSWTPTADQQGTSEVDLVATDPSGLGSEQRYGIAVHADHPPQIVSSAPTAITAGLAYEDDIQATDPDGDPIAYALTTAPAGMAVDAHGRVTWSPAIADIGAHPVTLTATDPSGESASQSFTLTVSADTQSPVATLRFDSSPADQGKPDNVLVLATDDVAVASLSLTVDGKTQALDAHGMAVLNFPAPGQHAVVATARDAAGNVGTATETLTVIDPTDTQAPSVSLAPLPGGGTITAPVAITGTVDDPHILSYTLTATPTGGGPALTIFSGSAPVNNGPLGTFDPTVLANGSYSLTLAATNAGGHVASTSAGVIVAGKLKLGDFRESFTDLDLNVSGVPITVTRTYDTLTSGTPGDFGYGWTLSLGDPKLEVSLVPGADNGWGGYPAFEDGTRVVVTLPGGDREGFTFRPIEVAEGPFGLFHYYHPYFAPDPGDFASLSAPDVELTKNGNEYDSIGDSGLDTYNPADPTYGGSYSLRENGLTYTIDATSGALMTVANRAGSTLSFSPSGISSDTGVSIALERDFRGRIDKITDPQGRTLLYQYDGRGDLVATTDRLGNVARYAYLDDPAHYLDKITDPEGNAVATTAYGPDGRVIRATDAAGDVTKYSYDPAAGTETITDPEGGVTTETRDALGDITKLVDPMGQVTQQTFDASGHMTRRVQVLASGDLVTNNTYDASGNLASQTDPAGATTRFTTDAFGDQTSATDALGLTTAYQYDAVGNLVGTSDGRGHAQEGFSFDNQGNLLSQSDASGTTSYGYNAQGEATSSTGPDGVQTGYTFDASGDQTGSSTVWTDPNDPSHTQSMAISETFDAEGNATSATDSYGHLSTTQYDADNRPIRKVDALGNVTSFQYDSRGNLIEQDAPDGTVVFTVYDALDRPIARTDPAPPGMLVDGTETDYDLDGRATASRRVADLVIQVVPSGASSTTRIASAGATISASATTYDGAGRVASATGAAGATIRYEYDADGRVTATTGPTGDRSTIAYDAGGNKVAIADALGATTAFAYDDSGDLVKTTEPDGSTVTATYDDAGDKISQTDQDGNTTRYTYDAQGRLASVIEPAVPDPAHGGALVNPTTTYQYDPYGHLAELDDAQGGVTRYTYNAHGQATSEAQPGGVTTTQTYDAFGRPLAATDAVGNTVVQLYDALGRPAGTQAFAPGATAPSQTTTVHYDAYGRLDSTTDASGTTAFTRDLEGHLTRVAGPEGTITYAYDPATGQETRVTTASTDVAYTHDAAGRIATVTALVMDGQALAAPLVTTYRYNADGSLVRSDTTSDGGATGVRTAYAYDSLQRLTGEVQTTEAGAAIASYAYTISPVGDRVGSTQTRAEADGSTSTTTTVETLDALGRLTGEDLHLHRTWRELHRPVHLRPRGRPREGGAHRRLGAGHDHDRRLQRRRRADLRVRDRRRVGRRDHGLHLRRRRSHAHPRRRLGRLRLLHLRGRRPARLGRGRSTIRRPQHADHRRLYL